MSPLLGCADADECQPLVCVEHLLACPCCCAAVDCKTMAACDAANGYPMTESMDVFNTICLNNVYWAERAFSGLYDQQAT
jgi:hypothetical protein